MIKNFFKKAANRIMLVLAFIVHRSKRNVVVGGWYGERFADNSKAMFLFLNEHRKEMKLKHIYFFTRNRQIYSELYSKGYECLLPDGLVSAWWHLRAKYHIVDENGGDIKNLFSAGASRVNLWHGFPLKKIGYLCNDDIKSYEEAVEYNNKLYKTVAGYWSKQRLLCMSDEQKRTQSYAFGLANEDIIMGAYPRAAYLLGQIKPFYLSCERVPYDTMMQAKNEGKKILLYLPTFRDNAEQNDKCADAVCKIAEALGEEYLIVTKMHFAAKTTRDIPNTENIINLPPESDANNFMKEADLLITDYSSVYFDWILLKKPLIFFPFDKEEYAIEDRGFLYDYNSMTPGKKVRTPESLAESIKEVFSDVEGYTEEYAEQVKEISDIVYGENLPTEKAIKALWFKIRG